MKPPSLWAKQRSCRGFALPRLALAGIVGLCLCLLVGWAVRRASDARSARTRVDEDARRKIAATANVTQPPVGIPPAAVPAKAPPNALPTPPRDEARTFATFQRRPFAVAKASGTNEWTAEDGRDPETIYKLAHNELEAERLLDENQRIKRRQLVYRKETVPILLQRAGNQPLRSFSLPALDGQEVQVEVVETRLANGLNGAVMGRVLGRIDSMVSVGFANGCESFNVVSPSDSLFLVADAREPGELMVKEIDPAKYSPPAGDAPDYILTNPANSTVAQKSTPSR